MAKQFEIGKKYTAKSFAGHICEYICVSRTAKTVTLYDELYKENFVKRIKIDNNTEYITFSAEFMGWCEMNVYA